MSSEIPCPSCGATDAFHTVEQVEAYSEVNALELVNGKIEIRWGGSTDYGGPHHTVGLGCSACGARISNATPDGWMDDLFPKPDLDGLLALRARMKGEPR